WRQEAREGQWITAPCYTGGLVQRPRAPGCRVDGASRRLGSAATMDGPTMLLAILFAAFGYGCGSVPVGVLVARAIGEQDTRSVGSGRTGTQNSLRAMGPRG